MNTTTLWIMTLVVAFGTYLIRVSFIAFATDKPVPPTARRILALLPSTVLGTLIFPAVIFGYDAGHSIEPDRIAAACVAAAVAWKTKSAPLTLLAGMVALWTIATL